MSVLAISVGLALAAQGDAGQSPIPPALSVPGQTANIIGDGTVDFDVNEKKSEMTLGYSWGGRGQIVEADGVTARVLQTRFSAELTLPLGGGDNLLSREAFNGLSDGPSLTFSWTSFGTRSADPWDRRLNPALGPTVDRAGARCVEAVRAGDAPEGYTEERCRTNATSRPSYDFVQQFSGLTTARLNRALLSPVTGYGIEGSVGLNRFNYRTPVTLAENSDTLRQFSVRGYVVYFPSDGVSMLTGSARYESSYEAQDDQILCRAVVANPNSDCVNAPPGPPERVEKLQFEVEYRRVFEGIPGLGRFSIAPRASYDVLNNDYELEFPIYLTPAGTNAIMPGVTISYDSRHDEVTIGLFLRKSFSF